jgi:hypothetical protein
VTLLTLRTFIETDLADAPLQVILDAANEDILASVGTDTSQIETVEGEGQETLWLNRPANSTFASITETDTGGTVVTLATNDYSLDGNAQALSRLNSGTNPKSGWTGTVTITYTPLDLNRRNRAIVQLVELDLAFRPGARSESIGDLSRGMQDYDRERARIISQAQSRSFA